MTYEKKASIYYELKYIQTQKDFSNCLKAWYDRPRRVDYKVMDHSRTALEEYNGQQCVRNFSKSTISEALTPQCRKYSHVYF